VTKSTNELVSALCYQVEQRDNRLLKLEIIVCGHVGVLFSIFMKSFQ